MPIQQQHYQITGMKQDNLVGTGFSNKFAHEIKNMRLNTIGDYTTGAWTTERGTKKLTVILYQRKLAYQDPIVRYFPKDPTNNSLVDLSTLIILGQTTINDQWILFGKINYNDNKVIKATDCILRLFYSSEQKFNCEVLYFGNLNFNVKCPIETLPYFENESIQKVYFTDGYNQPRIINIVKVKRNYNINGLDALETQFDFVREVALKEQVTIKKLQSGEGMFPPCTVKYAITYYDKYGQETNVVYDSPLYYPTKGERGCSPDELSGDSFEITVTDFDTNFDYIRLYSIVRTSNDATPIVRIVADKSIKDAITTWGNKPAIIFVDTNTTGEIVDPTVLQYVGGKVIKAKTFDQKTNTLFLGNITLSTDSASKILNIYDSSSTFNPTVSWDNSLSNELQKINRRWFSLKDFYPYQNQLNPYSVKYFTTYNNNYSSYGIKHFKKGEEYRFGLQFQDKWGIWSEVIHTTNMDTLNNNNPKLNIYTTTNVGYVDFAVPYITLDAATINLLYDNNYRKARLVCVQKNNSNRKIIAQGVIDSTVWEHRTRGENGPYAAASWFFRPKETMYSWQDANIDVSSVLNIDLYRQYSFGSSPYDVFGFRTTLLSDGTLADFHDFYNEIQNIYGIQINFTRRVDKSPRLPIWHVDREILTFHSPELEFDDSVKTLDESNYKLRVIGYVPIDNSSSSYYISSDYAPVSGTFGFTQTNFPLQSITNIDDLNNSIVKTHDSNKEITYNRSDATWTARLYPFQNDNMGGNASYDYKVFGSMLTSKMPIFGQSIYCEYDTQFTSDGLIQPWSAFWTNNDTNNIDIEYFKVVNKNDNDNVRIPISKSNVLHYDSNYDSDTDGTLPYLIYSKGLSTIAPTNKDGNYPIVYSNGTREWDTNPVRLTYSTNTHAVLVRNTFANDNTLLQWGPFAGGGNTFYESRPYLWLVNLEKEADNSEPTTSEIYIPCGPAYTLTPNTSVRIYGFEGDHYFMRYDCLKTFPRSTGNKNQIVEILSFMVETRINLDGRYDSNRGLTDNTTITDANFNKINNSYTQDNNFFAYTTLERLSAMLNNFTNQLTYTAVKVSNEDVDAWTNITLAKVDDADGTCGAINKIINVNDKLFLFQEHGIAKINYDEKTTLTTDTGVPIELNSSGKYTGIDYISREVGCQNKWSISSTKNGLLWVDDSRRELLAMDENLTSVTTLNGFDAFMIDNCNPTTSWIPDFTNNNFVTYYDKLSKDLYFINGNTCLAWNEISKTFTSFYDYNKVNALTTINNHTLVFKFGSEYAAMNGVYALRENNKYGYFFDLYQPYWMTLVCDGSGNETNNFSLDKVFDNIEYRADIFNMDEDSQTVVDTRSLTVANPIFDKKAAWNSYQVYKEFDINAERKFNTWRVQLPRATYVDNQGNKTTTRDRLRNPFCYIKLLNTNNVNDGSSNPRMILHDLAVSYSIK